MDSSIKNTGLSEDNIQKRILDTAEELFGEKGFDAATIRDITTRANCNLAAVNYHFGGKDNLYFEIFNRRLDILRDVRISSIDNLMRQSNVTLEDLLHTFADAFIDPLLKDSGGRRFIKIMLREMLDPRLPKQMFLEKTVIPVMTSFTNALTKVCPDLNPKQSQMITGSIVGQLLHIIRVKGCFEIADNNFPVFDLTDAVNHVVEFSAAGIRAMIKTK